VELIHTCYRITDPERSVAFYEALGLEKRRELPIRDEAMNYFLGVPGQDSPELELTYNFGVDSYELGTGYGHIALTVEDLDGTLERLAAQGIEPEIQPSDRFDRTQEVAGGKQVPTRRAGRGLVRRRGTGSRSPSRSEWRREPRGGQGLVAGPSRPRPPRTHVSCAPSGQHGCAALAFARTCAQTARAAGTRRAQDALSPPP
jgi:lactoylglutathione lyase